MKYMGSKNKISKYIVPIFQEIIKDNNIDTFIDACCGGSNVIDKIDCKNKIAYDINPYLIELFKYIQTHDKEDFPTFITKEEYVKVNKNRQDYPDWYVGLVGFLSSWNGRFFDGGYSGIRTGKDGKERNYYDECLRNVFKQKNNILDVHYETKDLFDIEAKPNSVLIYFDPPYKGTKKYQINRGFNHDLFWDKVRELSKDNIVLVSEYEAPDDFECIWEEEIKVTVHITNTLIVKEKLFKYKG